jgi:hypothetical protein
MTERLFSTRKPVTAQRAQPGKFEHSVTATLAAVGEQNKAQRALNQPLTGTAQAIIAARTVHLPEHSGLHFCADRNTKNFSF